MCIENKKTYILYVLDVLREYSDEEHRLSQKDIVDLLRKYYDVDIERRTVKSCVMNLIDTGYDISYTETIRGKGTDKENAIWTDFYLERDFTDGELRVLIDSILCSKYLTHGFAEEIAEKLKNMGSKHFRRSRFQSHMPDIDIPRDMLMNIEDISSAIFDLRKISFIRNEWGYDRHLHPIDDVPVLFSPFRLVTSDNYYHVIGKTDGEMSLSSYRLDALTEIEITEYDAEPNLFDVDAYIASSPDMLGGSVVTAEFLTYDGAIDSLIRHFGKSAVREASEHGFGGCGRVFLTAAERDIVNWAKANQDIALLCAPLPLFNEVQSSMDRMRMLKRVNPTTTYLKTIEEARKSGFLYLCNCNISKRHKHENLKGISSIRLFSVRGADCSFLRRYTDIKELSVYESDIRNGEVLYDMNNLRILLLENTGINNIEFICNMPMLSVLGLFEENVKDYSPLYELKNLKNLRIPESVADCLDIERLRKNSPQLLIYSGLTCEMPNEELIYFADEVYERCNDTDIYPLNVYKYLNKRFEPDLSLLNNAELMQEADKYLHFHGRESYEILTLKFHDGFSEYEIAKKLGVPLESVLLKLDSCQHDFSTLSDVYRMFGRDNREQVFYGNPAVL